MASPIASPCLVTLNVAGKSRTVLWDGRSPLRMGSPTQCLLHRATGSIRISRPGQSTVAWLEERELEREPSISIGKGTLTLRAINRPRAAIALHLNEDPRAGSLRIHSRIGTWLQESKTLSRSDDAYLAQDAERALFRIVRSGEFLRMDVLAAHLELSLPERRQTLNEGQSVLLKPIEWAGASVGVGRRTWHFGLAPTLEDPPAASKDPGEYADRSDFRRLLAVSALAVVLAAGALWMKPSVTEELPPDEAVAVQVELPKRLVKPVHAKALPAPRGKSLGGAQAFDGLRSSAAHALLNGSGARLLERAKAAGGSPGSVEAQRLLNAPVGEHTSLPNYRVSAAGTTHVRALGGGPGERGVGYASGSGVQVNGQGRSLVRLDGSGSSVEEGLTRDEVGEVIHRHLAEVRYCYESAMLRVPDVEGRLLMGFVIGGNGSIKSAQVRESTLADRALNDCVLGRLATWKFPRTKGGIDVAVTYPFIFKSLGG